MKTAEMLRTLADALEKGETVSFTATSANGTEAELEIDENGFCCRIDDMGPSPASFFLQDILQDSEDWTKF